jgi:outer membrane protein assembly factor BamA
MYKLLLIWIFWCTCLPVFSQGSIQLEVSFADSSAGSFKIRNRFSTSTELEKYIGNLAADLMGKGYLAASIDKVTIDSPKAFLTLFTGPRYYWERLTLPPEYQPLAQELGFPGYTKRKPDFFSPDNDYRTRLLNYFENNGYPFASVWFDSVQIQNGRLHGRMQIDKGVLYKIDSIAQPGLMRMNPRFMQRYLGLPAGAPYQQEKLAKISQRLDELSFAQQSQPWELNMLGTGGVVNVYLEQRRSNVLNVLLGVMPASTQTPDNKLQLTGDVNIQLRNSFRSGETIGVNWQQLQYKSPRLNLLFQQPYLFGSKAGIDFYFELFKKDTQFVNLQVRLGMPYEFSLNKTGKVLFHYQQTNVTAVDTQYVLATGRLPDLAATAATSLGFDFNINTTNNRLNPRNGSELNFSFTGGTKTIKPSADIQNLKDPANPGSNFGFLYDSLAKNTYQFRIKGAAARYFYLGGSSVLKLAATGATYESGNFFRNELFQIGGFRLLRGFDEESIYARRYAVLTTEYRLISGKNSFFFGFMDAGLVQYKDLEAQYNNNYVGAGLGMVLETKSSLINISWGIGKRNDEAIDFRQSKIHLGLINFF